jgi:hypothetical protein
MSPDLQVYRKRFHIPSLALMVMSYLGLSAWKRQLTITTVIPEPRKAKPLLLDAFPMASK